MTAQQVSSGPAKLSERLRKQYEEVSRRAAELTREHGDSDDQLPISLRRAAHAIGIENVLKLVSMYDGTDAIKVVPRRAYVDHPWAAVIGIDALAQLVRELGGQCLYIPSEVLRFRKKWTILRHIAANTLTNRQIAHECGCSERYVYILRYNLARGPK